MYIAHFHFSRSTLFPPQFFIQSAKVARTTFATSHTAIGFLWRAAKLSRGSYRRLDRSSLQWPYSLYEHYTRHSGLYTVQHDGNNVRQATVDQGSSLPFILVHVTLNTDTILTLPDLSPRRTHTGTPSRTQRASYKNIRVSPTLRLMAVLLW